MNNEVILYNSYLELQGFHRARVLTLVQGDASPLTFELKDKNKETVSISDAQGEVQIVSQEDNQVKALIQAKVVDGKATFVIDTILPVGEYELILKVNKMYFPSAEDAFLFRIVKAHDVTDIDVEDLQTIEVVINGLEAKIKDDILAQTETVVRQIITEQPELFRGEKGEPFTWTDFTDEQLRQITPEAPAPLSPDQMTTEQLDLVRGHSAYQIAVNEGFEGTQEEWFESLKGDKGDTGDSAYEEALKNGFEGNEVEWLESLNGLDGTVAYSDLEESQKAALRVPPKIYTRDEYNQLAVKDANTLYFIEEV